MIGVPSWVVPGSYIENLIFLAGKPSIETVELLFYLYDADTAALLESEWTTISTFSARFHFSAHLPDRIDDSHEALVARLSPLVASFVVHPPETDVDGFRQRLRDWRSRYGDRFYLENTIAGRLETVAAGLPNWPLCLDTGHCLLAGQNPAALARAAGDSLKEIHLHDVDAIAAQADGRLADHRALRAESSWLDEFRPFLQSFRGLVNLELFDWADVERSLDVLEQRN